MFQNKAIRWIIVSLTLVFSLLLAGLPSVANAEYGDVILNKYSDANDMAPVIYPQRFHRIRFQCKVCHSELGFKMKAGGNDVTMADIVDGQFCGMCHNGEIAWTTENCELCHSGKPGLKSGIIGTHKTLGPGIW